MNLKKEENSLAEPHGAYKDNSESKQKKDANTCMALGTGVGVIGTASAALTGAVCPLCIFIAPGLIGYGAYNRWKSAKKAKIEVQNLKNQS